MPREKNVQTKLVRLAQILRLFMEKERISSSWLAKEFRTTPRTIQRDLSLLKEAGFPLHEMQKGSYQLNKDLIKNLEVFDDTELALMVALKNIVSQLGTPFQKAADGVLERLYQSVTSMPVFVKIDEAIPLDSSFLNRMVKAIREKRQMSFYYTKKNDSHAVVLEPYRVVYFEGFWYLIGNEPSTGILKRYALDKIKDIRLLKSGFKSIPNDLDAVLQKSANIWFAEKANIKITENVSLTGNQRGKKRRFADNKL
ncbi:MAG TPA: WYL domain-containing protein [Smithellaceae bacterium]|nr:WYL domain-containing protein [Smithellaceae bacterium]